MYDFVESITHTENTAEYCVVVRLDMFCINIMDTYRFHYPVSSLALLILVNSSLSL